jgi:hypothetical protein
MAKKKAKVAARDPNYCIVCGSSEGDDDVPGTKVNVRKGLDFGYNEPVYICKPCDGFFQPVSDYTNNQIVELYRNEGLLRVYRRAMRLASLSSMRAPQVILTNEIVQSVRSVVSYMDAYEDIKRGLFETNIPIFSDEQLVELIIAAELALGNKKKII